MRGRRAGLLVASTLLAAACAPTDGVDDLGAWTVAPGARLTIGAMEGDSTQLFQSIADAVLLPDGRVVIADGGLGVVRVFDGAGNFVAQMGRAGEGPGEFQWLRDVWWVGGDTIGVWDSRSVRLTYFTTDGSLLRTVSLERTAEADGVGTLDALVGARPDGSVLLASIGLGEGGTTSVDRMSFERFAPDGSHLGRLARVDGMERAVLANGRASAPLPFTPFPHSAAHEGAVFFTTGAQARVRVWTGTDTSSVLLPAATHDVEAAWNALAAELDARDADFFQTLLPDLAPPDSIPHLAGLLVDDRARVWTKRYDAPYDALWVEGGGRARGGTWWVAEADGRLLAAATLPDGLIPLQVLDGQVLGLTVDELGVERIQIHALDEGG